jgi:hypothetical protein
MRTCLLFSGGWDSAAAFYASKKKISDLLFIDYNQTYLKNELESCTKFAEYNNQILVVSKLDLKDDIEGRNFYFLMEAKRLGYTHVVMGTRNILPLFDRFKDSNWFSIKLFCRLVNINFVLPILFWNKRKIVSYVKSKYPHSLYNCYYNNNDVTICTCVNCLEMRRIL